MSSQNTSYLKAGIWYMIGNILIKGVSFFALPIFTRLLTPEDFGRYNLFLSYEGILTIILGLGLSGTIKIAFFDFKEKFENYFSSVLSLTFLFTLVFDVLSIFVFLFVLKPYMGEMWTQGLVHLLIYGSLGSALYTLISTKYVICAEYKANLAISAIYTIVNVVLSIILCYTIFSTERYLARIVGYTLPLMLIAYGITICYIFRTHTFINVKYWSYAIKLGAPLIIHALSMVLLVQIGKIMINHFCGDRETGIYSIGATISGILGVVLSSFDNAWAPWFYRGLNAGEFQNLVKGNNKIAVVFAIVCSCFILFSPEMIKILTTKAFYDGIYSLVPLVVATYINFMYLFAVNQEYFYKKTKTIAIGTIIATITGIVLNYLLIPIMGYVSAAYVSCASNLVLLFIHTGIVKYWKKPDVISYKRLLAMLLFTIAVGAYTIYFKDNIVLRFMVVLVLCIVFCYYTYNYLKQRKQNNIA